MSSFLWMPEGEVGGLGVEVSPFTWQEVCRQGPAGSERILLDILEHDWREAQDSRQELCQKLHAVQGELQWAEELRDKVGTTAHLPTPTLLHHLLLMPWSRRRILPGIAQDTARHCSCTPVTLHWCLQQALGSLIRTHSSLCVSRAILGFVGSLENTSKIP